MDALVVHSKKPLLGFHENAKRAFAIEYEAQLVHHLVAGVQGFQIEISPQRTRRVVVGAQPVAHDAGDDVRIQLHFPLQR